jgi:hypothetical protein
MQRNTIKTDVRQIHPASIPLDAFEGPEIVKRGIWQIDANSRAILLQHRGDEDIVAEEELVLDSKSVAIGGVVVKQGIEDGHPGHRLPVESRVEIIQQAVSYRDDLLGCGGCLGPTVVFLGNRGVTCVVAHEGIKGSQRSPARTQSLSGVSGESANVGPDHGDLENGGEVEDTPDAEAVLLPGADVVAQPFSDVLAETDEGGASDEEGAAGGTAFHHGGAGGDGHHGAPEVVGIVVVGAVVVLDIRVHGLVADGAGSVVDLVGGVDEVASRQTKVLSEIGRVVGCLTSTKALDRIRTDVPSADGTLGAVCTWLESRGEAWDLATVGVLTDWWWLGWILGLGRVR